MFFANFVWNGMPYSAPPNGVHSQSFPLDLKPHDTCRCLVDQPYHRKYLLTTMYIANARRCLFSVGIKGWFQGNPNPLSGQETTQDNNGVSFTTHTFLSAIPTSFATLEVLHHNLCKSTMS